MRNVVAVLSALLIFLSFSSMTIGAEKSPVTLEEAINTANDELESLYGLDLYFRPFNLNGKAINPDRWKEKGRALFAYGDPFGDIKITPEGPRYRNLGKTVDGQDFSNPHFPNDAWLGGKLEDRNWIKAPWDNDSIKDEYKIWINKFNNDIRYLHSIQDGLKFYWSDVLIGPNSPIWNNWHEYVHILQPPTRWAWGLGRMWHQDSAGQIWYITIPMVPTIDTIYPDLSTTLEADSFQNVSEGQKITSTVTYKLNASHPKEETAWLRLHHVVGSNEYPVNLEPVNPGDTTDANGYLIIKPGESKKYSYSFTVQDMQTKILSRINPVSTDQDIIWSNNRDEALVVITQNDIKVEIRPGMPNPWKTLNQPARLFATAVVSRKDNRAEDLPVRLSIFAGSSTVVKEFTLGQGDKYLYTYNITANNPGSYSIEAQAWPSDGTWKDIHPPDNIAIHTIVYVLGSVPAPIDRKLHVELIDTKKY